MTTTTQQAKSRIINALGDLYRLQRHSDGLSPEQERTVADAIAALEAEYLALLGFDDATRYAVVTTEFRNAKDRLDRIKAEREELANSFVKASKILGSLTQVLKLL